MAKRKSEKPKFAYSQNGRGRKRIELLLTWWGLHTSNQCDFCKEFASNTYLFILSIFFESKQNFESRRGYLMRNRLCTHYNNGNIHINPNGTKQCMVIFSRKMELIQTFHVYAVRKINFIKFITLCIWYTRIHAHKYTEREQYARKGCERDTARNR